MKRKTIKLDNRNQKQKEPNSQEDFGSDAQN